MTPLYIPSLTLSFFNSCFLSSSFRFVAHLHFSFSFFFFSYLFEDARVKKISPTLKLEVMLLCPRLPNVAAINIVFVRTYVQYVFPSWKKCFESGQRNETEETFFVPEQPLLTTLLINISRSEINIWRLVPKKSSLHTTRQTRTKLKISSEMQTRVITS